jgi:hypothetical protein
VGGGGEDEFMDKEGEEIIVKEEDITAVATAVPVLVLAPPMPL